MPLIRIDAIAGRTPEQVKQLLDAAHRAMLTAFRVPERDRYQIYQEHAAEHFVVQDTGLGIARTEQVVVVTVVSRPRGREAKQKFYAELCRELKDACGMEASDVMVTIVTNTDEDWSFGNGRSQFLTGEL
jgi:phenylpyruvate tautomerase PptA (4-oxalocrotonate tautomerase family)